MANCSVDGCGSEKIAAKGLCMRHYQAQRRGRAPKPGPLLTRPHHLTVRFSDEESATVTQAAAAQSMPVSIFARVATVEAAQKNKTNS